MHDSDADSFVYRSARVLRTDSEVVEREENTKSMSLVKYSCNCFVLVATVLIAATGSVMAQGTPSIPAGVGPLPDLSKGGGAGVAISQPYAQKYSSVLPLEVGDLLARGIIAFEAALKSKNLVQLPEGATSGVKGLDVNSGNSLPESFSPKAAQGVQVPFPPPSSDVIARDASAAGYQILWNAASVLWGLSYLELEGRARIFQDARTGPRELQFVTSRLYPRNFGSVPGKLVSLFREKIALTMPAVLKGVTWLTLRYLTTEEDYLWASSPTTMSTRQMTGSNRGDLIFPRGFSPDDLFVWSGKVEGVAIRSVSKAQILVPIAVSPFTETPIVTKGSDEGCKVVKGSPLELSPEAKRVPQAPSWLPSNAFWELREVWKIEVDNRDPFALDTRSTLYIDAATYSPVYRVVFGDKGEVRRIVIGILGGMVGGGDGSKDGAVLSSPIFWRGAVLINPTEEGATVIEPLSYKVCSSMAPSRELNNFDPKALISKPIPKGENPAKGKPTTTTTPVRGAVEHGAPTTNPTQDAAAQQDEDAAPLD